MSGCARHGAPSAAWRVTRRSRTATTFSPSTGRGEGYGGDLPVGLIFRNRVKPPPQK
jgi:hypothetical protein